MTDETRQRVDEVALRLLGYRQCDSLPDLWFGPRDDVTVGKDGPSQDSRHVVPLAEALLARGYCVEMESHTKGFHGNWRVTIFRYDETVSRIGSMTEWDNLLPLALALAAARAVGEGL